MYREQYGEYAYWCLGVKGKIKIWSVFIQFLIQKQDLQTASKIVVILYYE